MSDCIFCAIAAGGSPAHVLYEDDATVAFLDIAPLTRGHTLVIPRDHHADLWDITVSAWEAVSRTVHEISGRIRERLAPDGLNLLQATRSVAFQTVFHLHVQVIPRWSDDSITVPQWPKELADEAELRQVASELAG